MSVSENRESSEAIGWMNKQGTKRTMTNVPGIPSKVLTVQEVSKYLRVHRSTIYRLLKQRRLPAFRVGSDWRFNIEAIDRWRSEMEASSLGIEAEPSVGSKRAASRQRGN